MRRATAVLTTVLLLGLGVPAGASCVGPEIAVPGAPVVPQPSPGPVVVRVQAGAPLVVTGRYFFDGCDDTGGSEDGGCSAPERERMLPRRDVGLVLVQGGRSWDLGERDAAPAREQWAVRWETGVPDGVRPGPALLEAGGAQLKIVVTGPR